MASFQELASEYARKIQRGASAADIARELDSLVYTSSNVSLSAADKTRIAELIQAHFSTHGTPVPGQPGVVFVRDSDNRAYLALVAQLFALIGK